MATEVIPARELVAKAPAFIIGSDGQAIRVTGEVWESSILRSHVGVEVSAGVLYIDRTEYVTVSDEAPTVVVSRPEDDGNDVRTFHADVITHTVDFGRSNLSDRDEFLDWAKSHVEWADALPAGSAAAEHVIDLVLTENENREHGFLLDDDIRGKPVGTRTPILGNPSSCVYEFDGAEDGIQWWRCRTHDELSMGYDAPCVKGIDE